jgi:probable HAF family extracellular repeat protein
MRLITAFPGRRAANRLKRVMPTTLRSSRAHCSTNQNSIAVKVITRLTIWRLAAGLFCVAPAKVATAAPLLRALDFYPADVSADGSVVAGTVYDQGHSTPVVWTSATGIRTLGVLPDWPGTVARSISADGSVVVGSASGGLCQTSSPGYCGTELFRWNATTGLISLGRYGVEVAGFYVPATDVSGDGSVITAGDSRWTADGGRVPLPGMRVASAVSDDGLTVVGALWVGAMTESGGKFWSHEATRWTAAEGTTRIGKLPGHEQSYALDVSADGSVVVGFSGSHLFRWTEGGGMVDLGSIATGWPDLRINTSADGSIIVGNWSFESGIEPFIWDEAHGIRSLHDVLAGLGVNAGGWDLESVTGISADGRTFFGYGLDPAGNASGWIVTVPEPASVALLPVAAAALFRRRGCRGKSAYSTASHRAHRSNSGALT